MFSFVKELDEKTTCLARELAENRQKMQRQFRTLQLVIVWVGGDKEKMAAWAKKNKLGDLPVGVTPADDATIKPWRLNPTADNNDHRHGPHDS